MASALRFGRYEGLFRIASGGMAEVFAGRVRGEGGFEKLVAVKRMLPHLAEDPQFVKMFLDEARVAANLASANVVQTLDIGRTDDGALYIVMELVLGLSLSELLPLALERGPIPIEVCVEVLAQAATGLHDAHEARSAAGDSLGLVHRDVSPQNLLIGIDGRVRITDFGIARVTASRLVQTQHGTIKGKFAYFSPEQSRGAELDRRSDVFALGVVAWEMVTGRRLFSRKSPTETVEAVRSADIPRIESVRPGLPAALADTIHRALERPIDRRWPTAREMGDALRESLGSAGSTPAVVASFVRELRADRIVQLEARVREAVASPEIRTLPDIEVELPDEDATVLDPPVIEATALTAHSAPIDGTVAVDPTAATAALAPTTTEARTAAVARTNTKSWKPRGALVAAGIVIVIAAGVAVVLSSSEPSSKSVLEPARGPEEAAAQAPLEEASPSAPDETPAQEPPAPVVAAEDLEADGAEAAAPEPEPRAPVRAPRTSPRNVRRTAASMGSSAAVHEAPTMDLAAPPRETRTMETRTLRPGQVLPPPEGL